MDRDSIINLGLEIYEQRDISPVQLGVTSRQINYWIDNAVVPFVAKQQSPKNSDGNEKSKSKWIRLDLTQAVWVCIVKELLSYGVSIDYLKDLAYQVWQKPREEKYADKVFKGYINSKKNLLSNEDIENLEANLNDEFNMENYFRTIINPFTDIIKSAVIDQKLPHSLLYIPKTNQITFLNQDSEFIHKMGSVYLEHTIISIPIVPIIAQILTKEFSNPKKDLLYLSNIARQIRDVVVFKKPKIVEIAFENNNIKPIVVTEEHKSREELSRYILENKIERGARLIIDIRSTGNYKLTLIK